MTDDSLRPDPQQSAEAAGLRYVNGDEPGIQRKPWGRGFTYLDPDGNHIKDEDERARLDALAIPPAWTEVWVCPDDRCHILATGRDEAGRKQYIYHPRWREVRDAAKYHRIVAFGEALPAIRERVEQDLGTRGLTREKVLATVVRLLDETLIRVGNREYAEQNDHYGLTTLQDEHVDVNSTSIYFDFVGKSGQAHELAVRDRRLARIVRQCRDVPGHHLFQYYGEDGQPHAVGSGDVNEYLREITGQDFTAKDFRTWGGTVLAAATLRDRGPCEEAREAKQRVVEAVKAVAEQLGNTPAVCREYYIHPGVLECYLDGSMAEKLQQRFDDLPADLHDDEIAAMTLLRCLEA